MLRTKKRNIMKLLYQLTAIILIILMLVSCGRSVSSGGNKPDSEGKKEVTQQQDEQKDEEQSPDTEQEQDEVPQQHQDEQQDEVSNESKQPYTASQSFSDYIEAKGELLTVLTDAVGSNPDTGLYSMAFFGIAMLDFALVPASCFGLGQEATNAALGILGLTDIEYTESGNQYTIKYRTDEGKQYEMQGEYDKAADALKCISKVDGKENLISEHRKTSFGYVGQVYTINEDNSTYLYQVAISGKDGVVGISTSSPAPSALTGTETIDFPKQCPEWYAIEGDKVTVSTSDGKEFSFVYTPTE